MQINLRVKDKDIILRRKDSRNFMNFLDCIKKHAVIRTVYYVVHTCLELFQWEFISDPHPGPLVLPAAAAAIYHRVPFLC